MQITVEINGTLFSHEFWYEIHVAVTDMLVVFSDLPTILYPQLSIDLIPKMLLGELRLIPASQATFSQ